MKSIELLLGLLGCNVHSWGLTKFLQESKLVKLIQKMLPLQLSKWTYSREDDIGASECVPFVSDGCDVHNTFESEESCWNSCDDAEAAKSKREWNIHFDPWISLWH